MKTTALFHLVQYGRLTEVHGGRILCHLCGSPCRTLASHLRQSHAGLTADAYRKQFGLPAGTLLCSSSYLVSLDDPLRLPSQEKWLRSEVRIGNERIT